MADENNKPIAIASLEDLALENEPMEINESGDAFADPDPVPDNHYVVKLELNRADGKSGFEMPQVKDGQKQYIRAQLVATIIEEGSDFHDRKVFDSVDTSIRKAAGTCTMATLLTKALKVKVPGGISQKDLAKLLAVSIGEGVIIGIETQWKASQKKEDGNWESKRGMKRFPPKLDEYSNSISGRHNPTVTLAGVDVTARANIRDYFPAQEVKKKDLEGYKPTKLS